MATGTLLHLTAHGHILPFLLLLIRVLKKYLSRWRILGSRWRLDMPQGGESERGVSPLWVGGGGGEEPPENKISINTDFVILKNKLILYNASCIMSVK